MPDTYNNNIIAAVFIDISLYIKSQPLTSGSDVARNFLWGGGGLIMCLHRVVLTRISNKFSILMLRFYFRFTGTAVYIFICKNLYRPWK